LLNRHLKKAFVAEARHFFMNRMQRSGFTFRAYKPWCDGLGRSSLIVSE
jgi:hypothetical protein